MKIKLTKEQLVLIENRLKNNLEEEKDVLERTLNEGYRYIW